MPYVKDLRADDDPSLGVTGRITDWDTLVSWFGVVHDKSHGEDAVEVGQYYWQLEGIELRSGVAAYITNVKTEVGSVAPDILVFRYWPGAPTFSFTPDPAYFNRGVAGFTGPNGDVGFGYSGDSVVVDGKGPDSIWISADPLAAGENRRRASDAIHNLGWLGSTDHLTPQPVFRAVKKGGLPPEEDEIKMVVVIDGRPVGEIMVIPYTDTWNSYIEVMDKAGTLGIIPIN